MALKQLMQFTHREGVVMAFGDVFLLLTFLFGGLVLPAMLVRKPGPQHCRTGTLRQGHFARSVSALGDRIKFSR